MAKKKSYAYLLWFFGGIFGTHHIYLERDKQAFIWYTTLGGFFYGYFRDLFRIPSYLKEVNEDEEYMKELHTSTKRTKVPNFKAVRFFGSVLVSALYGYVFLYSVPRDMEESHPMFYTCVKLLTPFACAIGAYLVNTESYIKCSFLWPFLGAYLTGFSLFFKNPNAIIYLALSATFACNWRLEWRYPIREKEKKRKLRKRLFVLVVSATVFTCLATSFLLHNASMTVDGQKTTLLDSIKNFFKSKAWDDLSAFFVRLWHVYRLYGWDRLKEEFVSLLDFNGMSRSYEILEIDDTISQKDLDLKCRQLSRKWHPDKYKIEAEKLEAEKKFMDIQEACNKVSTFRRNKANKNKESDEL